MAGVGALLAVSAAGCGSGATAAPQAGAAGTSSTTAPAGADGATPTASGAATPPGASASPSKAAGAKPSTAAHAPTPTRVATKPPVVSIGTPAGSSGGRLSWPAGYPKPCPATSPAPQPGTFLSASLMDPAKYSAVDTTVGDGNCYWYRMGVVDWSAKTVELLVADGKTGASKYFVGHVGDSVIVGRFNVRIVPPMGMWPGSHDLFDVALYWA